MSDLRVHFGGPDRPLGVLRDQLAERVAQVPAGGAIHFVTYYFRDRRLADDLLAAQARRVTVRVVLDGRPRSLGANRRVIERLSGPGGLGEGLRLVEGPFDAKPLRNLWRPRLHEKLYAFLHPADRPEDPAALGPDSSVWLGSFNPAGDEPEEEPDLVREIRDQDRGHNLLVELRDPALVAGLAAHAEGLRRGPHGSLDRFTPLPVRELRGEDSVVHFLPSPGRHPVLRALAELGPGDRLRIAASHVSGASAWLALGAVARRGVALELLCDETDRRVTPRVARHLMRAGAQLRRVRHATGAPMHAKFLLVDGPSQRFSAFGSFNFSEPSLRMNREIAVLSRASKLYDGLAARWEVLESSSVPVGRDGRAAAETGVDYG